jgi:hypothetical protein
VGLITPGGGGGGALSGVTVTGTAASGQVPVASSASAGSWSYPPGFEINYTQITANVNIASTTEATGTTILSPGAITFDGTAVLLTVYSPAIIMPTVSAAQVIISLFEGATQIGRLCMLETTTTTPVDVPVYLAYRFTPSAASHTYTITAFATSTTGTPAFGAGTPGTGTFVPGYARFQKA